MDSADTILYDCCILAVGSGFDRTAADELKNELLRYKLPKKIQSHDISFKRITVLPVPSGQEGPASDDFRNLAAQSRWLVVACSEAAKDNPVLNDLITYFSDLGRKPNILPLLVHGDPKDAFPGRFYDERETRYTDENGIEHSLTEVIEPLAVDIRAESPRESLRILKHLKIKVVAALIQVSYDTLEQRHIKRTRRKLAILASFLFAVPAVLGTVFTYLWLNSQHKIDIATQKTQISKDLFTEMCSQYPERFSKVPAAIPILNNLLLENLEKLKVAESLFVQDLDITNLLDSDDGDDLHTSLIKAMVLRYIGKSDDALPLYEKAAEAYENKDIYINSVRIFLKNTKPEEYASGVCIISIDPALSKKYGLLKGDIIVATDGFKFRSMEQYNISLQSVDPGKIIEITVMHPDKDKLVKENIKLPCGELVFTPAEI